MSQPIHVLIFFLATVLINRIQCIKLTRENVIPLGGQNGELNKKQISEIDPAALEVIKSTSLDLEGNKLTYLQEDLFQYNTNFKTFYFESNKISEIHPLVFQKLKNLTGINLFDNELTEIAENLFERNLKLKMISLYQNRITFFHPNTFKNLTKLVHLNVGSNQLTTFDLNLLSANKGLQILHFENNKLTEIDYQDLTYRFPLLSVVNFTGNKFNCSFARQIQDYLERVPIAEYFDSVSCISDEEYAAIVSDRHINDLVISQGTKVQLNLEEKFNNIITELRNYVAKIENANEKIIIENAKTRVDFEDMNNVIKGLKFQVLEQQSVTDELKSEIKNATESCGQMLSNSGRMGEIITESSTGEEYQMTKAAFVSSTPSGEDNFHNDN